MCNQPDHSTASTQTSLRLRYHAFFPTMKKTLAGALLLFVAGAYSQQPNTINPNIAKMIGNVSADRIAEIQQKLASFGTRNTMSRQDDPNFGIGAARTWIVDQLKSYSPRLQVRLDTHRVKKQGRITADVEMSNIVAVLPGTRYPDDHIILGGHYDSLAMNRPTGAAPDATASATATDGKEKRQPPPPPDPNVIAPGVTDDGSGTAAVMELARVMSQQEYEKTLVFILFVAEEEGLIGSHLYAQDARKANQQIEAVLNNDIIGSVLSGDGRMDNTTVRIFSEDPADSPSRQLARYIREVGGRYVPGMNIDLVFRADRFGRGGDHTSFNQQGYAAVRFSSAEEDYSHQHTPTDTFANTSPPYIAQVAKINGAVAASLALAPKSPVIMEEIERNGRKIPTAMISRGKSRYDALLRWKTDAQEPDLAGYVVLMRSTTAPFWEREIAVGKVGEYLMPSVSIDQYVFGIQAVDQDGNGSLVSAYTLPTRPLPKIETY